MPQQQTRRKGMKERRLLTPGDASLQNIVLFDTDSGMEVEYHEVANSESLFVLMGAYEVVLGDRTEVIRVGDLCYFPPNTSHGLRCIDGPGRFLAVFAPARSE